MLTTDFFYQDIFCNFKMEDKLAISVTEALEQLQYPSFFDKDERKAAFDLIMLMGNDEERLTAEIAKLKYPFEEQMPIFSSDDIDDFSFASSALSD